jgi:hypothetical protein
MRTALNLLVKQDDTSMADGTPRGGVSLTANLILASKKGSLPVDAVDQLSPFGVRLVTAQALDAGSVVAVSLLNPARNSTVTAMGRVSKSSPGEGGRWTVECRFARPLPPGDLGRLLDPDE